MILVSGSTGRVGREVVRALRERGAAVRAMVRNSEAAADYRRVGIETVVADLSRRETLDAAVGCKTARHSR